MTALHHLQHMHTASSEVQRKHLFILCLIIVCMVLFRIPAITNVLQSYPSDSVRWAAAAVNFAYHGFGELQLPLVDQGARLQP